jgi:glyoxylase I family protein
VHHVSINVTDVEQAARFYTDMLGFTRRTDRPAVLGGGAWLDAGAQQLHLIEATTVPPNLGQRFAVLVEELDTAVSELRTKGLTVSDPVQIGANWQSFVTDPDGNVVELHQAGPR